MKWIRQGLGGLLLLIGLVGFAVEIDNLLGGTGDSPVLGFALAVIFSAGGVALLRRPRRGQALRLAPVEAMEPAIFRLAQARGGRIGAGELTAELGMSFETAHQTLERLASQGACQVLVTEGGATIYRFAEFEGGKRDLLE